MDVGVEQHEQEFLDEIDWENLFRSIPDDLDLPAGPAISESAIDASNPSPNSDPSWFGQIEHFLLQEDVVIDENHDFSDDFFSEILLNAPSDAPSVGVSLPTVEIPSPEQNSAEENDEKEKSVVSEESNEDEDAQMSKKRKRQMRNRDSALRSRERKKVYVRELEMKSKFLEGECRRLEYALHCCVMENQILYQRLHHKHKALGVSSPKQESAVLPLESLLLGSLFWLVSIVCLFLLSVLPLAKPTLVTETAGSLGGSDGQETVVVIEAGNEVPSLELGLDFIKRRCRATKKKMKGALLAISPHSFIVGTVFG